MCHSWIHSANCTLSHMRFQVSMFMHVCVCVCVLRPADDSAITPKRVGGRGAASASVTVCGCDPIWLPHAVVRTQNDEKIQNGEWFFGWVRASAMPCKQGTCASGHEMCCASWGQHRTRVQTRRQCGENGMFRKLCVCVQQQQHNPHAVEAVRSVYVLLLGLRCLWALYSGCDAHTHLFYI